MKTPFAATLAGAALLSGAALAADLPAPAPMPYKAPTAVAPVYNWTGCYIAGGFGYGVWNQDHWDETSPGLVPLDPRSTNGGRGWMGLAGGGCDVEVPTGTFLGNLVFGVMADYDFMNVHGQATDMLFVSQGDLKQSSAWTVGGRVGFLVTPNLLTYTNGGFTQAHVNQWNLSAFGIGAPIVFTQAHTYNGWFLGGGTEYALNFSWLPVHGLFWRNEYRFSSFNKADLTVFPAPGTVLAGGFAVHQQIYEQAVMSELVWRFNFWQ